MCASPQMPHQTWYLPMRRYCKTWEECGIISEEKGVEEIWETDIRCNGKWILLVLL